MSIKARVDRLERAAIGSGKLYVIEQYEGETTAESQQAAGITPADSDLVVLLRRFSDLAREQRFVSCRELAA